jgi:hypothetical protein
MNNNGRKSEGISSNIKVASRLSAPTLSSSLKHKYAFLDFSTDISQTVLTNTSARSSVVSDIGVSKAFERLYTVKILKSETIVKEG